MTYLRKFVAFAVLLAAFMSPTVACMASDTPMTSEERACCQMMKNECGQKGMPASHGCCHKVPGSIYDSALNTKAVAFHPVLVPVDSLPVLHLGNPTSSGNGRFEHLDFSPPKPPPSTISVLRI